jgi:hypothetical protein
VKEEPGELRTTSVPSEGEPSQNEIPDAIPRSERELELCGKLQVSCTLVRGIIAWTEKATYLTY